VKKPVAKGGRKDTASNHDDDHDVWRHTAASIEPLKRSKGRVHPATENLPASGKHGNAKAEPASKSARPRAKSHAPAHQPPSAEPKSAPRSPPPALADFDRNSARKIRGGRVEIEARVDLHGMYQAEAHAALRAFLIRCRYRGFRYVLVITGKGKPASSSMERSFGDSERERGILRRNVPRWLEEPELRAIVVSYMTAAIQHGGEGAIYVHLRSKER